MFNISDIITWKSRCLRGTYYNWNPSRLTMNNISFCMSFLCNHSKMSTFQVKSEQKWLETVLTSLKQLSNDRSRLSSIELLFSYMMALSFNSLPLRIFFFRTLSSLPISPYGFSVIQSKNIGLHETIDRCNFHAISNNCRKRFLDTNALSSTKT